MLACLTHPCTSPLCLRRLHLFVVAVQGLLGPDPKVVNDILEAVWSGCAAQAPGKGREAAAAAFSECLCWLFTQVTCLLHPLDMLCRLLRVGRIKHWLR